MRRASSHPDYSYDDEKVLRDAVSLTPKDVDRELGHRDSILDRIMRPFRSNSTTESPLTEKQNVPQPIPILPKCNLTEAQIQAEAERRMQQKSPKQRVKELFVENEIGQISDESIVFKALPAFVTISATMMGSMLSSTHYSEEFRKKHRSSVWTSPILARRQHLDYVLLRSLVFGLTRGLKLAFTSTSLVLIFCTTEAYMGKSVYWSGALASAMVGGMYRMSLGLRGVVAGSIILGVPGGMVGAMGTLLRKRLHVAYEDLQKERECVVVKELNVLQQMANSTVVAGELVSENLPRV